MATNVSNTVWARLVASEELVALVKGNILPEDRDDLRPALVYEVRVDEVDQRYEGAGAYYYELTISVIADKMITANGIADSVIEYLKDTVWTDSDNTIKDCSFLSRDESYLPTETKNKRLAMVECRFDLLVG